MATMMGTFCLTIVIDFKICSRLILGWNKYLPKFEVNFHTYDVVFIRL